MKIVMTDQALNWFYDEMEVEVGDSIRFYARYGGANPFHEGFSLGMSKDDPLNPSTVLQHNGVTFFIEEDDVWLFNGHDLIVDFDKERDELRYEYR